MKKRRVLSLLLAAVIVFVSIPVFTVQADGISREAQVCRILGILQGADKSGVTEEYLSQTPTRLQAYIIALRLKGLYEKAGKFTSRVNFTDASEAGWAVNYLAFAKNTPELGWGGYPDGRFGVNDKISAQAFYKVMLETLGYKQDVDFTYAKTLEFADRIGLIEDAAKIAAIKTFTINDIAVGIYGALNTIMAGTDKRLVDILVDKGVFTAEKVEAAGLNSIIQIKARYDLEYGVGMVPVKDTYSRMGCYILENSTHNMSYEIKKYSDRVKFTEGYTTAFINSLKVEMDAPVMKDSSGVYYIPASFVAASAKQLGYEAEYVKDKGILRLQKAAVIKPAENELVVQNGRKKSIRVVKAYSDIDAEDITSQCTFAAVDNNNIIQLSAGSGEVTGRNTGKAEVKVSYGGKEIGRVIVHVVDVVPKNYPTAYYEQLFEAYFRMDKANVTDAYGAVWSKQTGTVVSINELEGVDTGSSLSIKNYAAMESGVRVDLSQLLADRAIKGKTSTLKLYAKGIKKGAKLYVTANVRTDFASVDKKNSIVLDDRWQGYELMKIDIPADTKKLTLDIAAGSNEEILIDAFTMSFE